jgi:hypothetical protein
MAALSRTETGSAAHRPHTEAHRSAAALAKKTGLDAGCRSDRKIEFSFLNGNLMAQVGPANIPGA